MLGVLQNTHTMRFSFGEATQRLLKDEFSTPKKCLADIADLGEGECGETALKLLLDGWFGKRNKQVRTAIEHAGTIAFYRQQWLVSVVQTLVCDDSGQFKLLTDKLALRWIHGGRHYENFSPIVGRHTEAWDTFLDRYWDYYASLQDYRAGSTEELVEKLRLDFDELFSTRTGYAALDDPRTKPRPRRTNC